ncbi:hypothetical protein [Shewanella sp. UCD-KL12]|uniref:hypothetical protein n=1 Tax=Shewanella sp. UCD-KL12 TaxID=1917163 RepID=UPI000970614F|nr:hypothetical protein [Shewanella sp. UCD-KL12]
MDKVSSFILELDELFADILSPQYVHVKFSDDVRVTPLYIGIIAYKDFEKVTSKLDYSFGAYNSYHPLSDEVLPGRVEFLRKLFDYLYISPNRESTKLMKLKKALYFSEWFIRNGNADFMESESLAIKAYVYWTRDIERQIKSGLLKWSRKSATTFQAALLNLFQIRFGDEIRSDLQQAIYSFSSNRAVIEVRSSQNSAEMLHSLLDIANGFTSLVINEENFPYKMEYLGRKYFIFPNDKGYVKTEHTTFTIGSYNYESGAIVSIDEVCSVPLNERKVHLWTIKDAVVNLQRNNEDKASLMRLRFADLACCCYLEVFLILTGMHRSEVVQIESVNEMCSTKSEYSNEFRAIKFRAKGKKISYRLHRNGVKALNGYLRLRKWLVGEMPDAELDKLFVRVVTLSGRDHKPAYLRNVKTDDIGRVYGRLKGKFFPADMKALTPREVRRLKAVVLHEQGISAQAVADTLNHSEEVSLKTYANTKSSSQADELAIFWRSVKEAAKQIKIVQVDDVLMSNNADISISTGHCADFNNPVESEAKPLIEPNCKTQYGCLYCTKYCCHADEEDVHKLCSLAFVVSSLKSKSLYLDAHHEVISKLHIRVNVILNHVKSSSVHARDVYDTIYSKVWELGELTPFWELRLRRYESMGVVF